MKKIYLNVACAGMDVHYKFSNVTFRDRSGKVVRRQRLDHRHRQELQERLNRWAHRHTGSNRSVLWMGMAQRPSGRSGPGGAVVKLLQG